MRIEGSAGELIENGSVIIVDETTAAVKWETYLILIYGLSHIINISITLNIY
jgi:hypothetical protein